MTFLLSELLPSGKPYSSIKTSGFQALLEAELQSSANGSPNRASDMLTVPSSALTPLSPTKKLSAISSVSLPTGELETASTPNRRSPMRPFALNQTISGSPLSFDMPNPLGPSMSLGYSSSSSPLSTSRNRIIGRSASYSTYSPLTPEILRSKVLQAPFTGKVQSTIRCPKCSNRWSTIQPFNMLTAYFPPYINSTVKRHDFTDPITLQDCLMSYTNAEKVNRVHCHHCKKYLQVEKRLSIAVPPPLLCIHLNRLRVEKGQGSIRINKIDYPVHFDAEFSLTWAMTQLDTTSYEQERANQIVSESTDASSVRSGYSSLSSSTASFAATSHYRSGTNTPSEASFVPSSPTGANGSRYLARGDPSYHNDYYLCAIIVHLGDASGGHYVCYRIKNEPSGDETNLKDMPWLYISDHRVTEVSFKHVQQQRAYMLFYKSKFDNTAYEDQLQALEEYTKDISASLPFQHLQESPAVAASQLKQSQAAGGLGMTPTAPRKRALLPTPKRPQPQSPSASTTSSNGSTSNKSTSTLNSDYDIFNKPSIADSYYTSPVMPANRAPSTSNDSTAPAAPANRQLLEPEDEPDRSTADPLRTANGPTGFAPKTTLMTAMRTRPKTSSHTTPDIPNGGEVQPSSKSAVTNDSEHINEDGPSENASSAPSHEFPSRPLQAPTGPTDEGFESILSLSKPKPNHTIPNGHDAHEGANGLPNGNSNGHHTNGASSAAHGDHIDNSLETNESTLSNGDKSLVSELEQSYAVPINKDSTTLPNGFIAPKKANGLHEPTLVAYDDEENTSAGLNALD